MKQIKIVSLLTTLTLLLIAHSFFAQEHGNKTEKKQSEITEDLNSDLSATDNNKGGMVYQCPMDWEVISNVPGRCSKCNMKLEEYTLEEAMNNLSENRQKKPDSKSKSMKTSRVEKENEMPKDTVIQHTENHDECCPEYEKPNRALIDLNRDGIVYQCSMDLDQISDYEGKCPECGMKLEKFSVEEALKNME